MRRTPQASRHPRPAAQSAANGCRLCWAAADLLPSILSVSRSPISFLQIDLAMEPLRREAMLAGSDGVKLLPQLHINGRYIGTAEDIQVAGGPPGGLRMVRPSSRLGKEVPWCQSVYFWLRACAGLPRLAVQELEDWGELNHILRGLTPEQAAAAAAAAAGIALGAAAAPPAPVQGTPAAAAPAAVAAPAVAAAAPVTAVAVVAVPAAAEAAPGVAEEAAPAVPASGEAVPPAAEQGPADAAAQQPELVVAEEEEPAAAAEEDLESLASGLAATAVAGVLAAAAAEDERQQEVAAAAAAEEELELAAAASGVAASAIASVLAAAADAEAEGRLAAAVAAAFAPEAAAEPPVSTSGFEPVQQQQCEPEAAVVVAEVPAAVAEEPQSPVQPPAAAPAPTGPTPGRNAAAAAAVAAIQASAADIIDRALRAAQRLDPQPQLQEDFPGQEAAGRQQGRSRAAAEAVAALQLVASELPSPDADSAHLICSPIKLRPELQRLSSQQ